MDPDVLLHDLWLGPNPQLRSEDLGTGVRRGVEEDSKLCEDVRFSEQEFGAVNRVHGRKNWKLEFRSFSGFGKLQGTAGASPQLHLLPLVIGAKQGLSLVLLSPSWGLPAHRLWPAARFCLIPQSIARTKPRESLWAPPYWQNNNFIRSGGRGHRQEGRSQEGGARCLSGGADSAPRPVPPRAGPAQASPCLRLSWLEQILVTWKSHYYSCSRNRRDTKE